MYLDKIDDDEKEELNVDEIMIEDQDGFEVAEDAKIEEEKDESGSPDQAE